jgi:hypothetical protein
VEVTGGSSGSSRKIRTKRQFALPSLLPCWLTSGRPRIGPRLGALRARRFCRGLVDVLQDKLERRMGYRATLLSGSGCSETRPCADIGQQLDPVSVAFEPSSRIRLRRVTKGKQLKERRGRSSCCARQRRNTEPRLTASADLPGCPNGSLLDFDAESLGRQRKGPSARNVQPQPVGSNLEPTVAGI